MVKVQKRKRTEAEMMALLRRRFAAEAGNGPAYAFIEKVRDQAGFDAKRTIDAMTMSLWPSRGLLLEAYEIKCSRSDTLAELRDPSKADVFMKYVDRFWLVCADKDFVQPGELPPTWGMMVPYGQGLRALKEAPQLNAPIPPDRSFLAALLRQAGVAASSQQDLNDEYRRGIIEGREQERQSQHWEQELMEARMETHERREKEMRELLGQDLADLWRFQPEKLGRAVRAALDGDRDLEHLRGRVQRLGADALVLAEQAERILKQHGNSPSP